MWRDWGRAIAAQIMIVVFFHQISSISTVNNITQLSSFVRWEFCRKVVRHHLFKIEQIVESGAYFNYHKSIIVCRIIVIVINAVPKYFFPSVFFVLLFFYIKSN